MAKEEIASNDFARSKVMISVLNDEVCDATDDL